MFTALQFKWFLNVHGVVELFLKKGKKNVYCDYFPAGIIEKNIHVSAETTQN